MKETLHRIQEIFKDVFDRPSLTVTRESNAKNVEGWDSLAQITLVSVIEQEFGIKFSLGELRALENVGDMVDLIDRKLEDKAA